MCNCPGSLLRCNLGVLTAVLDVLIVGFVFRSSSAFSVTLSRIFLHFFITSDSGIEWSVAVRLGGVLTIHRGCGRVGSKNSSSCRNFCIHRRPRVFFKKLFVLIRYTYGEYTSFEFDQYVRKFGIRHWFTCTNTPQQNGVA